MALVSTFPISVRDATASIIGGFSRRTVSYSDRVYTVTNVDGSTFFSIQRIDADGTVTTYGASGHATAVGAVREQNNIAAVLYGTTMHIVYWGNPSGIKALYYTSFDVSSHTWLGSTEVLGQGGVVPIAEDSVDMVAHIDGSLHTVVRANSVWGGPGSDRTWNASYFKRSTAGVWTAGTLIESVDLPVGLDNPLFAPRIDIDSSGRLLVLLDDGRGGLLLQNQWKMWESATGASWSGTLVKGLGQASICHTADNAFHAFFFGDKRHTIIKGAVSALTTTLGAIQFEQPYVEGGIVGRVNYGFGFSPVADGNDIHIFTAAQGQVFQGVYHAGIWDKLRVIANATGTNINGGRTQKIMAQAAPQFFSDGTIGLAIKQDDLSAKNWYVLNCNTLLPDRGGITHSLTIDGKGFMVSGPLQKADISQAVPRVSIATELKTEDTLSDLSSVTQYSWHHGRGERIFGDPNAFLDSDGLLTHIPDQITQQLYPAQTYKTGGVNYDMAGYPADALLYQGNFYILVKGDAPADNKLMVWDNTNTEWDTVTSGIDVTSGVPQDLEIWNEDLWVAQGDGFVSRVFDFSATAWKNAVDPAYCYKSFDNKLWRADNINEIYWSSNADTIGSETWTLLGTVDDGAGTTGRIRRFEQFAGTLLVFADFGVYQITSNGNDTYQMLPLLDDSAQRSSSNGLAAGVFQGVLYYNAGEGLTRFDGSTRQEMGPNRSALQSNKLNPMPSNKRGQFSSLVATDNLMYLAINTGSNTSTIQVYAGTGWHEFWKSGTGSKCRWVYHTPVLTSTGVLAYRNLWLESGGIIYHIRLPANTENPLNDSNCQYNTTAGKIILGWQDQNLPALYKICHQLIARTEGFTPNADPSLHVYFQLDEGTDTFTTSSWTYLTTFSGYKNQTINLADRMRWTVEPSQWSGAIGGLSYRRIRYMLYVELGDTISYPDGTSISPSFSTPTSTAYVVRAFGQRFAIRPERRFGFTAVLQAWDNITLIDGSLDATSSAREVREALYKMADQRTAHFLNDGTLTPVINFVVNPSFELDTNADGLADNWSKLNSGSVTTAISNKNKTYGSASQKVTVAGTTTTSGIGQGSYYLPPGVPALVSADMFVEKGIGARLYVTDVDSGNVLYKSKPVLSTPMGYPEAAFTDVVIEVPAFEIVVSLGVQAVVPTELADGTLSTIFYVDGVHVYFGEDAPDHFIDGDSPRCQWMEDFVSTGDTATPHTTKSLRHGAYAVYITGMNETFRTDQPSSGGQVLRESDIVLLMREATT